jgi:hypothetical protein
MDTYQPVRISSLGDGIILLAGPEGYCFVGEGDQGWQAFANCL